MWTSLTSSQLAERFAGPELDAIKNAALAEGQDADTLLDNALARITATVRGYVGGCAKNSLGPDGTIPDELTDAALALAVYQILTRLPGMGGLLDEKRASNRDEALTLLRDVSACKFAILQPESPATAQPASGTITFTAPPRQFTRESLKGVL